MSDPSPWRRLAENAGVSLLALVLSLGVIELALRSTVYNFKNYPVSPGPGAVYEINSSEFRTKVRMNSLNLRGRQIPDKKEGEFRILCLGDSFTFGVGVNEEDAYPSVLEKQLQEISPHYVVINGSNGRHAGEYYPFAEMALDQLKPDLVVVQLYIGNDFYDAGYGSGVHDTPERVRRLSTSFIRRPWDNLRTFLKENWVTLDFVWRRLVQIPFVDHYLFRMKLRYDHRALFLREYPEFERESAALAMGYLDRLHRLIAAKKVPILYLVVPAKEQVAMKRYLNNKEYDYRKPNRILEAFFKERSAPVLDLMEAYETLGEASVRRLYYAQDSHWTPAGSRDVAGRLILKLKQLGY